ncbi:ATP-binding cassette domain-containing protein [Sphaerisporangium album]|uniref:ATP-binding cassette domain-containing protein n=1 Tax=Sphaerisporangium album TaxID=509200 RepID=A0A367EGN0_9ACTN|nr:ATP-binding cassette domain-containing protein [Sphaerisporangium album]RCG17258.1 ATP-binding cassette domain-containing protein [Sphaerisporangium album]
MIHARALTRRFKIKGGEVEAVRGLDLDVEPGTLVAFLGPNGAGKSTSLRMLTSLLPPTSGTAVVAGHDVASDPAGVRRNIGYVGQKNGAGENFRVLDELVTQARCYGLTRDEARRRAREVLDMLELTSLATRKPGTLSGGQRRRLDIALGLVHRPGLLFLDEPTTGLDPQSRADVWGHILRLREEHGTTLFLTTHYLEEADSMAERVVIIDHGRVIADGTAARLKTDLAGDHVTLTLRDPGDTARATAIATRLEAPGEAAAEGTTVRVRVPRADVALPRLLRALEAEGVEVAAAETARPTLDDVFLTLTGRSLRETDGDGA